MSQYPTHSVMLLNYYFYWTHFHLYFKKQQHVLHSAIYSVYKDLITS